MEYGDRQQFPLKNVDHWRVYELQINLRTRHSYYYHHLYSYLSMRRWGFFFFCDWRKNKKRIRNMKWNNSRLTLYNLYEEEKKILYTSTEKTVYRKRECPLKPNHPPLEQTPVRRTRRKSHQLLLKIESPSYRCVRSELDTEELSRDQRHQAAVEQIQSPKRATS